MKTAAVICEYSPFHNGHEYLIRKALGELGFDRVLCIMSGNFVQRGEPAICDKYTRAACALQAGAGLVAEIPPVFATSSAREFAACAVSLAAASGVVDALIFGVEENASLEDLKEGLRQAEAAENSEKIRDLVSSGLTFPEARTQAVPDSEKPASNNILAMEYLRAIKKYAPGIRPVPVQRIGDPYASVSPSDAHFASATAIRSMVFSGDPRARAFVPAYALDQFRAPVHPDSLSVLLQKELLTMEDPWLYLDVSREIAGRLKKRKDRLMSFTERRDDTRTRQYTRSRISRALLHIALGITKEEFEQQKAAGYNRYFRVLGLRKDSSLAADIRENTGLPMIVRTAPAAVLLGRDLLYDQIYYSLTGSPGEYQRSPVILP